MDLLIQIRDYINHLIISIVKKNILILALIFCSAALLAQENSIILSGGYSFANIKESSDQGTGYNINAAFEFNPTGGKFVHGISFGFVKLTASETSGIQNIDYTVNSYPVYYSPKFFFGEKKIKPFLKGSLGVQYADLRKETQLLSDHDMDFGFYGGGGGGLMISTGEKLFIIAEYTITYASNSAYNDGWINSASGGIGFKF